MNEPETLQVVERPREGLKSLFIGNPMQMEMIRFRRRFLDVTPSRTLNRVLVGLALLSYVALFGLYCMVAIGFPSMVVLLLQEVILFLLAVVASHGVIAGERDRRSWDLLQVAPISQSQIVFGKFRSIATLLLGIQAAFLPFVLVSQFAANALMKVAPLGILIVGEALCFVSCCFGSAFTIYLSSRMKSANTTLVAGIASAVGAYAILPMLVSLWFEGSEALFLKLAYLHPWILFVLLVDPMDRYWPQIIVQLVGYSVLTIWLLKTTANRLERVRQKE
jgi:ABC-type transport system involved in multi-copper enzyme maturation permease subunit